MSARSFCIYHTHKLNFSLQHCQQVDATISDKDLQEQKALADMVAAELIDEERAATQRKEAQLNAKAQKRAKKAAR